MKYTIANTMPATAITTARIPPTKTPVLTLDLGAVEAVGLAASEVALLVKDRD